MRAFTTLFAACLLGLSSTDLSTPELSEKLRNILENTHHSKAYRYPTDITRGIQPKPIYSHNDYWNKVPFWTAISVGCMVIETDVHHYNGTLYVGHHTSSLSPERTLASLYLEPLLWLLEQTNPPTPFFTEPSYNSVYDWDVQQTLYLTIDIKNDAETAWPLVVAALKPLRDKDYLSKVVDGTFVSRPVTVIGTGAVPHSQFSSAPTYLGDTFYDGDLPITPSTTPLLSPIASGDFLALFGRVTDPDGKLNSSQRALLDEHVRDAHARGVKIRYWQMPWWPVAVRNGVWRELVEAGVDFVNADDLEAAAGVTDRARWW